MCDAFVELAHGHFVQEQEPPSDDLLKDIFAEIAKKVVSQAGILGLPARDLASTLVAFVQTPDQLGVLQLGDGAVVMESERDFRIALWPDMGEALNLTHFVTDSDATGHLRTIVYPERFQSIAAFSDGLQMLLLRFSDKTPHEPFFRPVLDRLRSCAEEDLDAFTAELREYLNHPLVNARTDDDKTLILVTRKKDGGISPSHDEITDAPS